MAFLDTNALHFMRIYLDFAAQEDLFPFNDKEVAESTTALDRVPDEILRSGLRRGMNTINRIVEDEQLKYVYYAAVSELELLIGLVRGKAIINASKEGIPDRIWSHYKEKQIRDHLSSTDHIECQSAIDRLNKHLDQLEIRANYKEETRDILKLAKGIVGLVYMDAMDCIIYASALINNADVLYTADEYFYKTVNRIHNSSKERYVNINRILRQRISQMSALTCDEVELVSAQKV